MPQNLQSASPSGVFPQTLNTVFEEQVFYASRVQVYHDQTIERGLVTDGVNPASQFRSWALTKKLSSSQMSTLTSFIQAHYGYLDPTSQNNTWYGPTPFYFYDPYAAAGQVGTNYDPTGVSTTGRLVCVFTMESWDVKTDLGRSQVKVEFKVVA